MNITQAEAGVLAEAVRWRVRFLVTLRQRMERTGRTANPAFALVRAAECAMRSLWAELHFRGCGISQPTGSDGGNGRAEKAPNDAERPFRFGYGEEGRSPCRTA